MIYNLLKFILFCFIKVIFRVQVIGKENIPLSGPVVIASNHTSLLDPPIIGVSAPRKVYFMAKQELFMPIIGTILKLLGAFPVKRGSADRTAIKHGIELLNNEQVLVVFPEGTRSKTGQLGKAQPGALMMAAKSNAVIIPTAVQNAHNHFWPKITITFGKPLNFPPEKSLNKEILSEMADTLMQRIAKLLKSGELQ
ncbi:MAG TPA: 1-acyl-sn-glycerol-3-phosphate acyltransferase [Candidatus Avacidaminococcus intestinavium]|uniref:1-acyl-sn-glycerol-3-phosphate acyltransferase n=1 Tax=Candidatus Avacidaminococcus intestinavium TaxID=2840684 RepID=A0A9D1SLD8_9FIRM|nr:1-acyl-sn-glycerol-3-phosphate acyltransferase [Candidatus Avacidaminococcus intestinavium]